MNAILPRQPLVILVAVFGGDPLSLRPNRPLRPNRLRLISPLLQVAFWVLNVITARTIVGIVIILNLPVFRLLTETLDGKFRGRPGAYLFTVMVRAPYAVRSCMCGE